MANWANVEFCKTTEGRCVQVALSWATDLVIWRDFLGSLGCAIMARSFWHVRAPPQGFTLFNYVTFSPEAVIESLMLALTLRAFIPSGKHGSASPANVTSGAIRRLLAPTAAFISMAIANELGQLAFEFSVVGWISLLLLFAMASRWISPKYAAQPESACVPQESADIVGLADPQERVTVPIVSNRQMVTIYDTPHDQVGTLPFSMIAKLQQMNAGSYVNSLLMAFEYEQSKELGRARQRSQTLPVQSPICQRIECEETAPTENHLISEVRSEIVANKLIDPRYLLLKTILDKAVATVLLVVLLPLIAMVAILVKATSEGPVIFRQTRRGWCGQTFTIFKFRTMHEVPHAGIRYVQTKRDDPRCTKIGRVLRSTSLDELPQLWNVIIGDMALVGPRPHADMLEADDRAAREIIADYALRYRVKPGITGWAQIHGARGATTTLDQLRQRVTLDLYYIDHWSLWLDFTILARTPMCMVGRNVF